MPNQHIIDMKAILKLILALWVTDIRIHHVLVDNLLSTKQTCTEGRFISVNTSLVFPMMTLRSVRAIVPRVGNRMFGNRT